MNKWDKLGQWLKYYDPLYGWLYFNGIRTEQDTTSFNSVPSDRAIEEYIDGSKLIQMIFSIVMIKGYEVEVSATNYEAIAEVDNFAKWIENRVIDNDFPNFGKLCRIDEIKVLDSTPSLSVDTEQNLAKYEFQCSITYYEESED